jgi:serine/threonine protein phosphatase 1
MSTVAVGDIHGRADLLKPLLATLRHELKADDVLVFLGDYVDRGPDVRGCLELLSAWRREPLCRTHFLMGNHEEWLLRTRSDPTKHSWVVGMNGLTTVASYAPVLADHLRAELRRLGPQLLLEPTPLPYERFFSQVPESHLELLDALELACETPDAVLAHAGYDASLPASRQEASVTLWGAGFPEGYAGEKPLVYGHHANALQRADGLVEPLVVGNTHGIDSVALGALMALRLPDGAVFRA